MFISLGSEDLYKQWFEKIKESITKGITGSNQTTPDFRTIRELIDSCRATKCILQTNSTDTDYAASQDFRSKIETYSFASNLDKIFRGIGKFIK